MKRIFPDYAYGSGPRSQCWWDETIVAPDWPKLQRVLKADVAIIGGGFTGMSAALHLAEAGASVAVLEANSPGWGASGRNGGFCCLGGALLDESAMVRQFGVKGAAEYWQAEQDAVALVGDLLDRLCIDADRHSNGETQLAHNARAMRRLRRKTEAAEGVGLILTEAADLADEGLGGSFYGALTTRVGFGLNPRKYLFGLAKAASRAGAQVFQNSPALAMDRRNGGYVVQTPEGRVESAYVLIATNGYSSEDIPHWLAARYMPAQSAVLVTRPLNDAELSTQGWTSDQMAYDTRNLLHYFRLMPDRRFLFGMRGGLMSSSWSERRVHERVRKDFEAMFPAWKTVSSQHKWSGMVCLSRNRVPFVGPLPDRPNMFAGLAFHGNGVAMGSYAGRLLCDLVLGRKPHSVYPAAFQKPMRRFPMGRARRLIMPPVFAWLKLLDI
jgi:glycine/D-amino acid oxidase-like deaminating enzyme